jgi:hypothetical protein
VDTVTVVVPVVAEELKVTVPAPPVQVGRSDAPVGDEVSAQLMVAVPAYPVVEATVTVEVAVLPGEIPAGDVAATV